MSSTGKAAPLKWGDESRVPLLRRWHDKGVVAGKHVTAVLLDGADLRPGLRVLDLACGAGTPALDVARSVGPAGRVVAVDTSETLLALGREYAQAGGLPQVEFRAADAMSLPFPDESFDRVTSRFGAMYFADLQAALSESLRVLRPGGLVAWLVWGPFDQPFFQATVQVAMRHAGIREVPPETAHPFCFAAGGILERALRGAGFEDVQETRHEVPWSWPGTPEEACESFFVGAPPFRVILDRLTPSARTRTEAEIVDRFRAFQRNDIVEVPQLVILATGRRKSTASGGTPGGKGK